MKHFEQPYNLAMLLHFCYFIVSERTNENRIKIKLKYYSGLQQYSTTFSSFKSITMSIRTIKKRAFESATCRHLRQK